MILALDCHISATTNETFNIILSSETYSLTLSTLINSLHKGGLSPAPVSSFAGLPPPPDALTPWICFSNLKHKVVASGQSHPIPQVSTFCLFFCHCVASATESLTTNCSNVQTYKIPMMAIVRMLSNHFGFIRALKHIARFYKFFPPRPVLRLRNLMRLNACPLPGLTNSFSTPNWGHYRS